MSDWRHGEYAKEKNCRGYSPLKAVDPHDGREWTLLLSDDKMTWVASQGRGRAKELGYTVPWALLHPSAILRGVREYDDGSQEGSWFCYVATPPKAYDHKTGREVPAWENEVFLVFVTDERVAYLWYWCEADKYSPKLPLGHESRFTERVL